jgi:4-amino-4-deoxy-L-arabinose transferase-like glycosyltransferase
VNRLGFNEWRQRWPWPWLLLGLLFLLALFALRFLPAGQTRFAVDEAHHAGWALLIAHGDPFMRTIAADKPPQLYYLVAASFKLFGDSEISARLPNTLLGVLLLLPLWGLARRLYPAQPGVALLACGLFALSPLAQVYAPTVFTDPLMAFWLVVCAWLVASRRWLGAGVAFGLAICGKQQALFFLPFPVFVALLIITWESSFNLKAIFGRLLRIVPLALAGTALPVAVVVLFDKWRGQASSLAYGAAINGDKLGLAAPTSWPSRLANWWDKVLQYFFIPEPFGFGLLALLLVYSGWLVWRLAQSRFYFSAAERKQAPQEGFGRLADLALILGIVVVVIWHTALTFPVWDRYLLPMVPFAALVVARALVWLAGTILPGSGRFKFNWKVAGLALVVFGLMVGPVAQAENARLPLGGDYLAFNGRGPGARHAYDGIEQLAVFFRNNAPPGSVVFHEEMDWDFSYYLFGLPVQIPSNHSQPLDPALVASAANGPTPAYVVFADWQGSSFQRLSESLAASHLWLEEAYDVYPGNGERLSFAVYRVTKI